MHPASDKSTPGHTTHARDISSRDVARMSALTQYPQLLKLLIDKSREAIGFFPAHNPRTLEYPWILANVPTDLRGLRMLDVGAGVNPLPLVLADRGASVITLDNHPDTCNPQRREQWSEWGFLDYSALDSRIESVRMPYEESQFSTAFDCVYCVSVIEHIPSSVRETWISKFAAQVKPGGLLLLTVDLIPDTNLLWNLCAGQVVEGTSVHGEWSRLLDELSRAGFAIQDIRIERHIPDSRVDAGFVKAIRNT